MFVEYDYNLLRLCAVYSAVIRIGWKVSTTSFSATSQRGSTSLPGFSLWEWTWLCWLCWTDNLILIIICTIIRTWDESTQASASWKTFSDLTAELLSSSMYCGPPRYKEHDKLGVISYCYCCCSFLDGDDSDILEDGEIVPDPGCVGPDVWLCEYIGIMYFCFANPLTLFSLRHPMFIS